MSTISDLGLRISSLRPGTELQIAAFDTNFRRRSRR